MASAQRPIAGGMTAPPNTPIIIRPEISFPFSGLVFRASEYIIEKMLEQKKPIRPTAHIINGAKPAENSNTIEAIAAMMLIDRKSVV